MWRDNNEYDGEWQAGKMHGQGTFVWSTGERYDGEWKVCLMVVVVLGSRAAYRIACFLTNLPPPHVTCHVIPRPGALLRAAPHTGWPGGRNWRVHLQRGGEIRGKQGRPFPPSCVPSSPSTLHFGPPKSRDPALVCCDVCSLAVHGRRHVHGRTPICAPHVSDPQPPY